VTLRLGRSGYEVVQAFDGHEALDLALARLPDLCLLDVTIATEYIAKPFSPRALESRVQTLLERTEIDLGHLPVPRAVQKARVEHTDHPPTAQLEQHLQRAVARLFGVHAPTQRLATSGLSAAIQ
jgi:DNA-binding response OmpR family regulator